MGPEPGFWKGQFADFRNGKETAKSLGSILAGVATVGLAGDAMGAWDVEDLWNGGGSGGASDNDVVVSDNLARSEEARTNKGRNNLTVTGDGNQFKDLSQQDTTVNVTGDDNTFDFQQDTAR